MEQLARRVSFRHALRKGMQTVMRSGANGIRAACAGRLDHAEMSRSELCSKIRV